MSCDEMLFAAGFDATPNYVERRHVALLSMMNLKLAVQRPSRFLPKAQAPPRSSIAQPYRRACWQGIPYPTTTPTGKADTFLPVNYTVLGFAYCSALITSMQTNGSLPSTQAS
jgi:hypothetical protein